MADRTEQFDALLNNRADQYNSEIQNNIPSLTAEIGSRSFPVPTELGELGDVNLTNPQNNQTLKYNSSTQKWENGNDIRASWGNITGTIDDQTDLKNKFDASLQMLSDTVGWTGRNKVNYDAWKGTNVSGGTGVYENNGVTLTATSNDCFTSYVIEPNKYPAEAKIPVEAGKTYILTWDCDKDTEYGRVMIFPNGISSGTVYASNNTKRLEYTAGSGVTFVTFRCGISNHNGSTVKYSNIMFREASISDSTFEPYHQSVENVLQDAEVTPSKNKFPLKLSDLKSINNSGTWNGKTYTHSSGTVTYAITTLDDDETVTNIRMNGTAPSGNLAFRLTQTANLGFGGLKLCGVKGGSSSSYRYYVYDETSTQSVYVNDDSNPVIIPTTYTNYRIMIQLVQGYTASKVDFQPMLVDAGEDDLSFHYYFEPLKDRVDELTDELTTVTDACTNLVSGSTADTNVIKKCGNTVFLNLALSAVTATGWDTVVAVLPSAYRPSNNILIWAFIDGGASVAQIYSNGNIRIGQTISSKSIRLSATWVI